MWSIEAVIARHEAGLTTGSERVAMEEERAAAAVASGVPPAGAGGAEASRGTAGATTMKVVAAVDASEESLRALSWALDHVVRQNPGASVVVVHAQHRAEHFVYPGLAYALPMAVDSMKKTQEENARRVVTRALEVCAQRQVTAKAAVVEGDPKEAICQAVEDMHADLLVLGSRGLGMIKRALLGSVSDYLAHHASCPVLIVKPPKAQTKGTGNST
ncbi:hypothetical protein ACQ4PT_001588 [Festuca glaucescens]